MSLLREEMLKRSDKTQGRIERELGSPESVGRDTDLPPWLSNVRIILAICAASILVYANSLAGDFVFDDVDQVVHNQSIRSWDNLAKAFTTHVWAFRDRGSDPSLPPPLPYYRPLFTAAITVEYKLFGLWPQGWHLFSLFLHIVCSIEVFWVLRLITGRKLIAAASALLFAVHPVHAESVCWISGITDPLYVVPYLGSFYVYLKWRLSDPKLVGYKTRRTMLGLSILLFVVATFAKETALSLPALIVGYELIFPREGLRARFKNSFARVMPYVAAALVYLTPRYLVLGVEMFRNAQAADRPLAHTLFTLPYVVSSYLLHLLIPLRLSVTYATHFVTNGAAVGFIVPLLIIVAVVLAIALFRKRLGNDFWLGLLLILVPLVPVLRLGQVSQEAYLVFDHYLYLSVAGWALVVAEFLSWMSKRVGTNTTRGFVGAMMVLLLAYGALAVRANGAWEDSYALWSNATRVSPAYWAAHYNAGLALLEKKRFVEARESLETASRLKPDEAVVYDALGRAHQGLNDKPRAIDAFRHAIEIDSSIFEARNNLGTVYFNDKDYTEAQQCFESALRIRPSAVTSRYNLGLCYARLGRLEDAARELKVVSEAVPEDAEASYELGIVYERLGRFEQARALLTQGLEHARSEELSGRISEALLRIGPTR